MYIAGADMTPLVLQRTRVSIVYKENKNSPDSKGCWEYNSTFRYLKVLFVDSLAQIDT